MTYNPWIIAVLLALSVLGLLLGGLYYIRPERIVHKRVKDSHWETAKKDPEFRKWLDKEIATQVNRTKRMGMVFIILEAIWIALIIGMWLTKYGK